MVALIFHKIIIETLKRFFTSSIPQTAYVMTRLCRGQIMQRKPLTIDNGFFIHCDFMLGNFY